MNETRAGGDSGGIGGMTSDQPDAAITELLPIAVPDAPVELVEIRRRSGSDSDLLLVVENRSNQPVTLASYRLMFPACAKLEHAPARWISYGDRSLLDARQAGKAKDPPIAPRARAELVVPHDVLQTFRRTIDEKCPGKGPPELVIAKVAFADATGWEAYGKSSGYAGRPWKPGSGATPQK
jgi:hypothetical protein